MSLATINHLDRQSTRDHNTPTLPFRRPLFVANSTEIGGGNTSLLALVQGMRERGLCPTIVHPEPGPMLERCEAAGIAGIVQKLFQPGWKQLLTTWKSLRAWRKILHDSQADLIHANEPFAARTVTLAAKLNKTPLVCHVHFDVEPSAADWIFRRLPSPNLFLFCSEKLLADNWPAFQSASPAALAQATCNGIDVQRFSPQPVAPGPLPRIGILANLIPIKGHRDFLQMASCLQTRGLQAEYWIIGADVHGTNYDAELKSHAQELGVHKSVRFCGYCEDVPAMVNQLDVVVCASHQEPFGLCLAEAMACEKPVVATRVGGIPEVVDDGVTGIIVPPHEPESLAAAVRDILQDPERAREMGRRGRERVCEHFTHAAYVDRVLAAYALLKSAD